MDKTTSPEMPASPEQPPVAPEQAPEKKLETEGAKPETQPESTPEKPAAETGEAPLASPLPAEDAVDPDVTRDAVLMEVERELEDGLWEAYKELPPNKREQFKAEGERVAKTLREGLAAGSLVAKNVIKLIMGWLKLIPGVNKWFLRQEAKTKTDAVMALQEKQKDQ